MSENPYRIVYRKNEKVKLNAYFNTLEFQCKCAFSDCQYTIITPALPQILTLLRDKIMRPVQITSGFRCEKHNLAIEGHPNSLHKFGAAVDIAAHWSEMRWISQGLNAIDVPGVGIGKTFCHIDLGIPGRRWTY